MLALRALNFNSLNSKDLALELKRCFVGSSPSYPEWALFIEQLAIGVEANSINGKLLEIIVELKELNEKSLADNLIHYIFLHKPEALQQLKTPGKFKNSFLAWVLECFDKQKVQLEPGLFAYLEDAYVNDACDYLTNISLLLAMTPVLSLSTQAKALKKAVKEYTQLFLTIVKKETHIQKIKAAALEGRTRISQHVRELLSSVDQQMAEFAKHLKEFPERVNFNDCYTTAAVVEQFQLLTKQLVALKAEHEDLIEKGIKLPPFADFENISTKIQIACDKRNRELIEAQQVVEHIKLVAEGITQSAQRELDEMRGINGVERINERFSAAMAKLKEQSAGVFTAMGMVFNQANDPTAILFSKSETDFARAVKNHNDQFLLTCNKWQRLFEQSQLLNAIERFRHKIEAIEQLPPEKRKAYERVYAVAKPIHEKLNDLIKKYRESGSLPTKKELSYFQQYAMDILMNEKSKVLYEPRSPVCLALRRIALVIGSIATGGLLLIPACRYSWFSTETGKRTDHIKRGVQGLSELKLGA